MDLLDSLDSRWSSSSSSSSPSPSPSPLLCPTTTNASSSFNTTTTSSSSHSEIDASEIATQNVSMTQEEYEEYIATTTPDLTSSLRLIADSIAEQRQIASRAIIHSLPFSSTLLLIISALALWMVYGGMDWISWAFSCVAILAGALRTVEYLTSGYLDHAESISWDWACSKSSPSDVTNTDSTPESICEQREKVSLPNHRDIIWITKWKDITVGTLLLRISVTGSDTESKRTPLIRAWTVEQSYRHIGIGGSLLRRAIQLCRSNGWKDPSFAIDHANSFRNLPGRFNGEMTKGEIQARRMLERELQK